MRRLSGRVGLFIALAATAALFGWAVSLTAHRWRPATDSYPHQGVDVAARDTAIDWDAVRAAGASFAYIRATDGTARDPRFEDYWHAAAAADLRRGATHRWSLCRPGIDQANAFNTTVPRSDDALPVALELDFVEGCADRPPRDAVLREIRRFLGRVETHGDRPVVLQVSRDFDDAYRVTEAFDLPVWALGNFLRPGYPARPWRMWRASDMRRIDGVDDPINWDVVAT